MHTKPFMDNIISFYCNNSTYLLKQVEIPGLPPHCTHILQPLNVGVFNHLKKKFQEICISSGMKSARACITKSCFPIVWKNCVEQAATPNVVQSAFRRSGLCPFDPTAIDSSQVKDNTW